MRAKAPLADALVLDSVAPVVVTVHDCVTVSTSFGAASGMCPVVRPTGLPMTTNRIVASVLSIVLLALLGWSIFAGVADLRIWGMLGAGAVLGLLYTAFGSIPDWIIDHCGGAITDDDDPSNISPRVYLPILFGIITAAVIAFFVVLRVF